MWGASSFGLFALTVRPRLLERRKFGKSDASADRAGFTGVFPARPLSDLWERERAGNIKREKGP